MKWKEDDTIRFYRDVPDKRGVSEMVINTPTYPAYSIISGNVAYVLIPSSLRSQRFYRWSPPFFVPTKTIKSPNFTLGKGEKRACVYRRPSLFPSHSG